MAQRSVWRQLGERGPDVAQRLLSPPDAGSDGHHRPGWFPPGPQPDLLEAARTQRGDPRHDPPRPGLPGRHNLPPRFQCLRDQPLTGTQEPPAPSVPSVPSHTSSITTNTDPSKTASVSLAGSSACSYGGQPAPSHLAPASPCVFAAPAEQLQADTSLPTYSASGSEPYLGRDPDLSPIPSSTSNSNTTWLNFPKPPNLFSLHSSSNTLDVTLPHTLEPRRSYPRESKLYYPFRGRSSHCLPLSNAQTAEQTLPPDTLPTVASEPNLLTHTDTNASPAPPLGSHLPHFPTSPCTLSIHDTVLTHGPASCSSLPPPPPCPTGPGKPAAWGCCCSLGGAAAPLSHYLGKVGHAALPLFKAGGLLNAEPSDVQT